MITVNSISGGKTSSYMTLHYPADVNIFAMVCIDDPKSGIKDKSLELWTKEKLKGNFIATPERDGTIKVLRDLEQKLGSEIIFVRDERSFDDLIAQKKALPNRMNAFCSYELKVIPIFKYCFFNLFKEETDKVKMAIGYRAEEVNRTASTTIDYPNFANNYGKQKRQTWVRGFEWREVYYPLREDRIFRSDIINWARSSEFEFPKDDNCAHCFWKNPMLLKKNHLDTPEKIEWAASQEKKTKARWRKDSSHQQIINHKPQLELSFMDFENESMCSSGMCIS